MDRAPPHGVRPLVTDPAPRTDPESELPLLSRRTGTAAGFAGVGVILAIGWFVTFRASEVTPRAAEATTRPNFLMIDIDTLAFDRVGAVREGQPVTPVIDSLAARGVRFTLAMSQAGWTLPALSSVLTGALPVPSELEDGAVPWRPRGARDLPEILTIYGYSTAVFWGKTLPGPMSNAMSPSFGFVSMPPGALTTPPTGEILRWLGEGPAQPFFLYVHDIDLHQPWPYREMAYPFAAADAPARGPHYRDIYNEFLRQFDETGAQAETLAHYDSVLNLYDAAVGRILDGLQKAGLADDTIIVLTSDHGEDFFEHAAVDHGLLYDSNIHIPLIVVDPHAKAGPHVVDTLVQAVDIAPTVLALAGIPADAAMDGQPLTSLLAGQGPPYDERPVFSMSDGCHVSWRTRAWKLLLRDGRTREDRSWYPAGGANGVKRSLADVAQALLSPDVPLPDCSQADAAHRPRDLMGVAAPFAPSPREMLVELYDLVADPHELTNVVDQRSDVVAALLPPLLRRLAQRREAMAGAPATTLRPDQVQEIRDQGYWGFVDHGTAGGGPPPPARPPAP